MAKNDKLGKLLLGSALAGAAIGTLTYFLKCKLYLLLRDFLCLLN